MSRICFLIGFGVLASWLAAAEPADPLRPAAVETEEVPVIEPKLVERLRPYLDGRSAGFEGWSPDGRGMLVRTRFGNTSQLHRVYKPGGRREQWTFAKEPVYGRFLPGQDDRTLLLVSSRGGDENYQIQRYDRAANRKVLLTDGQSRNRLGPVAEDGRLMIYSSNRRNGTDTDLYAVDPRDPKSDRLVLKTDGAYHIPYNLSPDGKRLLVNHYVSINESYPGLVDVSTGEKTPIPPPPGCPDGKIAFGGLNFAADGKSVYLTTDARGEFRHLARVDAKTFHYEWLTADIPWDVRNVEVDAQTGAVAFTVNANGASHLYLLKDGKRRQLEIPLGIVSSLEFSPDGRQLGLTLSRADAPSDAYSLDLANGRLTRWTFSEVGGLDTSQFITPEPIEFKTFDGRIIPAFYYRPRGISQEKPAAVLIHIHGGPEGQYRPYFSGLTQFYLNEFGIAIITPNVRGSAGYGKSYLLLDNGTKREDSVRDIGALLDWIAARPELDAERVAVRGGSYGGYMVLGSLVNFPDRIKAGVDIVGIANFITFLERTKAYRRDLRRAEYGDERDPEIRKFFEAINPSARADRIESALLVAHGVNDPRVPFFEAEQIAKNVRARGRTVWTIYASNEGHGFSKKDNRDYLTAAIAMFLKRNLLKRE